MIIMCIYFDTCCINSNYVKMITMCQLKWWLLLSHIKSYNDYNVYLF